jgi:hypothetical protein
MIQSAGAMNGSDDADDRIARLLPEMVRYRSEAEVRALIQIGCLDPHGGGAQASEPRAKINPGQTTLMRNFSKTKNWN